MYCTRCGSRIGEGNSYCTSCGAAVLGNSASSLNNVSNNNNGNSKGNVSLVFGILAFIFFWMPILSIIFAIIGIVFGVRYRKETGEKAIGIIFSIIGLILSIIMIICVVLFSTYFVNLISNEDNLDYIIEEYGEYFDDNSSFDISGYDWLGDDGSVLQLDKGGSYSWYQDSNASGNSYFLGDYVYYNGYEAMNYIADNLDEYSITREEQRNFFKLGDFDIEDYYLIILNCEKMVIEGIEQQPTVSKMYYYGFFDDDSNRLELINMNSGNEAGFTLKNIGIDNRIDV